MSQLTPKIPFMASLWIRSGYDMKVGKSAETYQVGAHLEALNDSFLMASSKILEIFFPFQISQPPCDWAWESGIRGKRTFTTFSYRIGFRCQDKWSPFLRKCVQATGSHRKTVLFNTSFYGKKPSRYVLLIHDTAFGFRRQAQVLFVVPFYGI